MFKNLSKKQIIIIVIILIIVAIGIYHFSKCSEKIKRENNNRQFIRPIETMENKPLTTLYDNGIKQTPFTLYNFYDPECGWAKKFIPAWNEIAKKLETVSIISVKAVDTTDPQNKDLAFYYGISGSPTVILVTPNRNVEYSGDRSVGDLLGFVTRAIKEY
uniref:Thioredoxin domain-containing protein n=1 Tax=viral metagenome TaxID=1070528 RepID=A0A6C0LT36_9ZZZZ